MKKLLFLLCMISFSIAQAMNQKEVPTLRQYTLKSMAESIAHETSINALESKSAKAASVKYAHDLADAARRRTYGDYSKKELRVKGIKDTVTPILRDYITQALGLSKFTLVTQFEALFPPDMIAFNPHNDNQLVTHNKWIRRGMAGCDISAGTCAHLLIANRRKLDSSIAYTQSGLAVQVENSINLYDATRGSFIRTLVDNPEDPIKDFCYDSAHDRIIFTTETNKIMATNPTGLETLVAYYDSTPSERIVCGNQGNSIAIRHFGKLSLYEFVTHTNKNIAAPGFGPVAYAAHDDIIAYTATGMKIKLLDILNNRVKTYSMPDLIQDIAYNPAANINEFAASAGYNVYIINPDNPVQDQKIVIATAQDHALRLAYNAKGTLLAVGEEGGAFDTRIYKKDYYQSDAVADIRSKTLNPIQLPTTEWIKEDLSPHPMDWASSWDEHAFDRNYPGSKGIMEGGRVWHYETHEIM